MPELPEVEVTRRGIAARLHGARVLAVRCGKPLRWPLGCLPESLVGLRLGEITRRGKYLWLPLQRDDSAAAGSGGLLLHLGMSGSLALHDAPPEAAPHAHFDLQLMTYLFKKPLFIGLRITPAPKKPVPFKVRPAE